MALTSVRLRRLGSGVAARSSGEPAWPLLRFELMIAAAQLFDTWRGFGFHNTERVTMQRKIRPYNGTDLKSTMRSKKE